MPKKYICPLSSDELKQAYIDENRTLAEMCEIVGVKSVITMSKILRENGIETNRNIRLSNQTRKGVSDKDFETFLRQKYASGLSISAIASEVGVSASGVRKYFLKYNIERRGKSEYFKGKPYANPNWKGGRTYHNGYIQIYCPDHPNANKNKNVYEHQLVMEQHIGRFLRKGEVVHHIDGNKSNNDISNLLLLTNADHSKLHAILKRSAKLMGASTG